jgi:hypothetical protein
LDFAWFCLPSHGRYGDILVGTNSATLQVKKVETGDFRVKIHMRCQNDGFERVLVPVMVLPKTRTNLLSELVHICEQEPLPMLVGGAFDIIRQ